ncbi:uncharacterized protein LOC116239870 [Phasianus colchicus]|uniref:uncharacterized protein LOC116239870 n=1 Tax=Phasianus colchicus TaxID=9054 RepID=UPI00129EB367|nr:uncharacterized protein LOC116239870 [Phasianus colchicus]
MAPAARPLRMRLSSPPSPLRVRRSALARGAHAPAALRAHRACAPRRLHSPLPTTRPLLSRMRGRRQRTPPGGAASRAPRSQRRVGEFDPRSFPFAPAPRRPRDGGTQGRDVRAVWQHSASFLPPSFPKLRGGWLPVGHLMGEAAGSVPCRAPAPQTKVFKYRIWDTNQQSLYLRDDQLVAGHLQGANAALEEKVFWVPNRFFKHELQPVIMGIRNGTRCLACPAAARPTLRLQVGSDTVGTGWGQRGGGTGPDCGGEGRWGRDARDVGWWGQRRILGTAYGTRRGQSTEATLWGTAHRQVGT